ncbi:MAG TPA: VWA domain-containing protein [Gammaproteobacteria bacterium]|nr:VWA domain-containing protein [Gammaproteobacteria bacterium]
MRPARREINVFSLSFIDSITCAFGALVLLYMTIVSEVKEPSDIRTHSSEVDKVELKVLAGRKNLVKLKQDLSELLEHQAVLGGVKEKLTDEIDTTQQQFAKLVTEKTENKKTVEQLQAELADLKAEIEKQSAKSATPEENGNRIRSVVGEGNRQYLTGLRMGGSRVVILVDCSTSMLDRTIVNVIRRRNMSEEEQRKSPKWVQTVNTVDWLTAQLKPGTQFQILGFSDHVWSLIDGTDGKWLKVTDGSELDKAVEALKSLTPKGPTSLSLAFDAVRKLQPEPDDIYLLTDGLPTMGEVLPARQGVTGKERLDHFQRAVRELPVDVPVNIILLAMEGDPQAAPAYWWLALKTGGSMLAPSEDWP